MPKNSVKYGLFMAEFLDPAHQHAPYNFLMSPDLGGTKYDFLREVSRDKLTFSLGSLNSLTRLTIPGDKSFVHIEVENIEYGVCSEAYYSYLGDLVSANIWFRRSCDQSDFIEKSQPDDDIFETYNQLTDNGTDIMFEADLIQRELSLYYCEEDSTADNIKKITSYEKEMSDEPIIINFSPSEEDGIIPVRFVISLVDSVLTLGFSTNENKIVYDMFSTQINLKKLTGKSSPEAIRKILEGVFVQY